MIEIYFELVIVKICILKPKLQMGEGLRVKDWVRKDSRWDGEARTGMGGMGGGALNWDSL